MISIIMRTASSHWHFSWLSLRQRVVAGFLLCLLVPLLTALCVKNDPGLNTHGLTVLGLLLFAISFMIINRETQLNSFSRSNVIPQALHQFLYLSLVKRLNFVSAVSLLPMLAMAASNNWHDFASVIGLWSLSLCAGMSTARIIHRRFRVQYGLLIALWMTLMLGHIGILYFQLQVSVSIVCCFAWPISLWHSLNIGKPSNSKEAVPTTEETNTYLNEIKGQLKRVSRFSESKLDGKHSYSFDSLLRPIAVFTLFVIAYVSIGSPFATNIHLHRSLLLVSAALIMSKYLVARDLHWRYLLRPHGLGSSKFASSLLVVNLAFFGTPFVLAFLLSFGVGQVSLEVKLQAILIALAEITSLLIIAITIAAKENSHRSVYYGLISVAFIFFLAHGIDYFSGRTGAVFQLFVADWRYAATLLMFSAFALRRANLIWNRQRLLNFLNR